MVGDRDFNYSFDALLIAEVSAKGQELFRQESFSKSMRDLYLSLNSE